MCVSELRYLGLKRATKTHKESVTFFEGKRAYSDNDSNIFKKLYSYTDNALGFYLTLTLRACEPAVRLLIPLHRVSFRVI